MPYSKSLSVGSVEDAFQNKFCIRVSLLHAKERSQLCLCGVVATPSVAPITSPEPKSAAPTIPITNSFEYFLNMMLHISKYNERCAKIQSIISMSDIYLYNTASKSIELFTPLQTGKVGVYSCGPTVYHYAHIGNMRAYVLLTYIKARTLVHKGYEG